MPTHVYECPFGHGKFERQLSMKEEIPQRYMCPHGLHWVWWRPSAPYFIVEGGTGAARGGRER